MGIQERDYYKDPYLKKKSLKDSKQKILVWAIVIIVILGLILSLIPPTR
jgi:uncharacterized Rmd1/YagE family protein